MKLTRDEDKKISCKIEESDSEGMVFGVCFKRARRFKGKYIKNVYTFIFCNIPDLKYLVIVSQLDEGGKEMQEVWKGCIGFDAFNNLEMDDINSTDITDHLNKECKEFGEEQHNNKTKLCFCDNKDYCNGGNSGIQLFYKIIALLVFVFCA